MAKTIRTNGQLALVRALVDARQNAGLSQQQLAAKLKRHQSFVARLESGERLTCHGIFPPPSIRVRPNLRTDNEANEIHGRT
ncbi:helix-turn-helix domain-containing protein, partial [Maritimibacter harenae]|uniref:helix-turn-helix domain-containing protein n=1 Tax=Maritimibacter harenae TaxID=2606218 RepID=UPI002E2A4D5C